MLWRSVPAFDSVRQMPPRFSPLAIAGRKRLFCSSVPKRTSTSHITEWLPITPARPSQPRAISSNTIASVVVSTSAPPYCSGIFRPNRPSSFIWRISSWGYSLRCSRPEATGITSFSTNLRTVLTMSSRSLFPAPTQLFSEIVRVVGDRGLGLQRVDRLLSHLRPDLLLDFAAHLVERLGFAFLYENQMISEGSL